MIAVENISLPESKAGSTRRDFLRGIVGAGAFVLAARYMPGEVFAAGVAGTPGGITDVGLKGPLSPGVYLAIDTDGTVYAIAHRSEMGSGSRTALPRIIADELDADWVRVKIVQATGDEKYGDQDTDGSHSVRGSFDTLRETGAAARLMLVRAAAHQWSVPEAECSTGVHEVLHTKSGKKIGYGELVTAAAKRIEAEAAQRMALHRQGRRELRPERYDHRQSDLRHRCANGRDALCECGASSGFWCSGEICGRQSGIGGAWSKTDRDH